MKKKILWVRTQVSPNILNISTYNTADIEIKSCLFGRSIDKSIDFHFNLCQNDYSIPGWISVVNASMVSIFNIYIPDVIVLSGYNLTSVGAALAAYFMGVQIFLFEEGDIGDFGIEHFPMEKGFELLMSLVDFHFCSDTNTYDYLKGFDLRNLKFLHNRDFESFLRV